MQMQIKIIDYQHKTIVEQSTGFKEQDKVLSENRLILTHLWAKKKHLLTSQQVLYYFYEYSFYTVLPMPTFSFIY